MKTKNYALLLAALVPMLASCGSVSKKPATEVAPTTASGKAKTKDTGGKSVTSVKGDDLDDYGVVEISDPLEPLNRATFKLNDAIYNALLRPISKGYKKVFPEVVRKGIYNAFDNVKYPVRFVNCTLQFKFKRAGQETGKFLVNTTIGVGGLIRQSDKIPSLTDVPPSDTGQTFAVWGIGHGAYLVLPILGPSSVRDGIGYAGDYVLDPVNWAIFWHNAPNWTLAPPTTNTIRAMPSELSEYDAAVKDAVDPYLSVRSAYIQNRAEAARK